VDPVGAWHLANECQWKSGSAWWRTYTESSGYSWHPTTYLPRVPLVHTLEPPRSSFSSWGGLAIPRRERTAVDPVVVSKWMKWVFSASNRRAALNSVGILIKRVAAKTDTEQKFDVGGIVVHLPRWRRDKLTHLPGSYWDLLEVWKGRICDSSQFVHHWQLALIALGLPWFLDTASSEEGSALGELNSLQLTSFHWERFAHHWLFEQWCEKEYSPTDESLTTIWTHSIRR